MEDKILNIILDEVKYIKNKVDNIEGTMVTKDVCNRNMAECPLKTEVKKKR